MTPGLNNNNVTLHVDCEMFSKEPAKFLVNRSQGRRGHAQQKDAPVYLPLYNGDGAVSFVSSDEDSAFLKGIGEESGV